MVTDKHKGLLVKKIEESISKAQKDILDNTECAVEGKDRWTAVRRRILKATNDAKRNIHDELKRNWDIKYNPEVISEDIMEISPRAGKEIKGNDKNTKNT